MVITGTPQTTGLTLSQFPYPLPCDQRRLSPNERLLDHWNPFRDGGVKEGTRHFCSVTRGEGVGVLRVYLPSPAVRQDRNQDPRGHP